tara:strand:- start:160 stop:744 length:585 start_codon:yes stop_codon:yes gene_type:complete
MEAFKTPNLKAPRFRADTYQALNKEFFDRFRKKYPQYKKMKDKELRKIVKTFNKTIFQMVIDNRNGVQLPESIGWLFIGTCQPSKKKNIDFAKSRKYGVKVANKNWDSDGKLAKIFFTSRALKHKMKNREFWSFSASREFKRSVAKSYPENWNMYVEVDPRETLKLAYNKKIVYKEISLKKQEHDLKNYNEFDL